MDSVEQQLASIMNQYSKEVDQAVQKALDKTAKDTAKELKNTSPKKTGSYAKGWGVKKDGKKGRIIHNRTDGQLTHLLENGHVIRNAKGTYGRTSPIKHIEPAEQKGIQMFVEEIERGLE